VGGFCVASVESTFHPVENGAATDMMYHHRAKMFHLPVFAGAENTSLKGMLTKVLRFLLALLLVGTSASLPAQQEHSAAARPISPSPGLTGIAHVALRVADLQASVAFYEKLGYTKAFELSKEGHVDETFIKINDEQFIELYPVSGRDRQIGFLHLCFESKDIASVNAFYLQQGLSPTPVKKAGAGNLLFTMTGPDTPVGKQNMEYTQYMPGSLHSRDVGQHLGPDRIGDKLLAVRFDVEDPQAARRFYVYKLHFSPVAGGALRIPGSIQEVQLRHSQDRRFLCDLTLESADRPRAEKELTQRSISFHRRGAVLVVQDPDGNQIVLKARSTSE
jgi:catechol 2,3-dioxygenase-like lactoylglutathione lyase family enzyme